jgi:dTDP-4-amino-4,6-dideoxygalactose transaminase
MESLKQKGIGTEIYYPVPFHLQECFRYLGHKEGDLPESERAAKETVAIPIYPELTAGQQSEVVEAMREFYADGRTNKTR